MKTEKILMSDAGTCWHLDETPCELYRVEIEPGPLQLVIMGQDARKPAGAFEHPNLAAKADRVHEFKHYRGDGSKFWTAKPGRDFYFVIPRDKIFLLPEKGYSWVPAEIEGVKIRFNVCGGSGSPGWVDFIRVESHISVGHSLADMRKIASVALRGSPLEPINPPELDDGERKRFNRLMSEASGPGELAEQIASGKLPVIILAEGCTAADLAEGVAQEVNTRKRFVVANFRGFRYRIKINQIDWTRTRERNAA